MPGICGAIKLGAADPASGPGPFVSVMLSAMAREPFYISRSWICPSGSAHFATLGLESLQRDLGDAAGPITGLAYGRPRLPRDFPGGDWLVKAGGFCSFAARDARDNSYSVAVDRRASEPVYYANVSGYLCFAPEVAALLALPGVPRTADFSALGSLLVSGHLRDDLTLFSAIRRLPGGQALIVREGVLERRTYWEFKPGIRGRTGTESLLGQLDQVLADSVASDLQGGEGATAVFLSGGCDSRAILGYARQIPQLCTVSWGLDNLAPGTDAEIAERLASLCRARHLFLRRDAESFGQPFEEAADCTEYQSDVAAFHPQEFRLMRLLRESGFRRVVRGDEIFGWKKRTDSRLAAMTAVGLRGFGSVQGLAGFFRADMARRLAAEDEFHIDQLAARAPVGSASQFKDHLYFTQRLQNYLNSCAVPKQRLLEHANPLLADEVLDFLSLVPDDLRSDKRLLRLLVERRFPDLHELGYARSDGLENWPALWTEQSALRAYLGKQLEDTESGVWDLYDRDRLRAAFAHRGESFRYGASALLRRNLTRVGRDLLKLFSIRGRDRLHAELMLRAPLSDAKIMMRFLVVKQWVDRCSPVLR